MDIKFGTDGWRGIIARDFTFENVTRVALAIAGYLQDAFSKPVCAVGYDTRFMSREFALRVADVLSASDIKVVFSKHFTTSPALSCMVKKRQLSGGVMITASHNPACYNGIKFKSHLAVSASADITKQIESRITGAKNTCKFTPDPAVLSDSNVTICDFQREYIDFLRTYVDLDLLKRAGLKVIYDTMHGAGIGILSRVLAGTDTQIVPLRSEINPGFAGINPEPIEENLTPLKHAMQAGSCDLGIAIDGDGDRIGAVSNTADYIECGKIFALLLLYLAQDKLYRGSVVKTISSTSVIDKISEKYNLQLHETPIGFKNIAQIMLKETVLIGAEESGGMSFLNYLAERDGILSGILLMELIAQRKKPISVILKDIEKEYGSYYYARNDVRCDGIDRDTLYDKLKKNPINSLEDSKVVAVKSFDGVKFIAEDSSWLLLRFSGTEPILRIYTEAGSKKKTKALLELGRQTVESLGGKIIE